MYKVKIVYELMAYRLRAVSSLSWEYSIPRDVELDDCLRALKERGYQGYFSLEYEAEIDSKDGVERSLEVLRESLQKLP